MCKIIGGVKRGGGKRVCSDGEYGKDRTRGEIGREG